MCVKELAPDAPRHSNIQGQSCNSHQGQRRHIAFHEAKEGSEADSEDRGGISAKPEGRATNIEQHKQGAKSEA